MSVAKKSTYDELQEKHSPKLPGPVAAQVALAAKLQGEILGLQPEAPAEIVEAEAPSPAPEAPSPAPDAAPAPPSAPQTPEQWEQIWRSEQGRVRAAEQREQQAAQRMQQLEREIAQMRAQPAQPAPLPPELQPHRLLTPEEEADYGTGLLDVVGKKAKEAMSPEVAQLRHELAQIKGQLGGVTQLAATDAKQRVFNSLTQYAPGWEVQNDDQGFIQWLDSVEPLAGVMRRNLLNDAMSRHDATRVVNIFLGYRRELAMQAPSSDPAQPATPPLNTGGQDGKVPLISLAAPGKASSASPPGAAPKATYTSSQIQQFYTDNARGKFRGRETEYARIDADISLAAREGRIHPG